MEEPEREVRNHDRHTFHLPNVFSRTQPSNEYHSIPGGEEEGDELVNREAETTRPGVEASREWQAMSGKQHAAVRIAFGILGAAVLLPFNALITPSEYYRALLTGTPQGGSFMSWIIAVYNVSCILFGAHATTSMHKASVGRRIISAATAVLTVLLLTTVLVLFFGKPTLGEASGAVFPLMLCLTLVLSAATSYLQLAVVTLSNAYGPSCMGAMLSGQGVVGASVSLVQLVAALSATSKSSPASSDETQRAALHFFAANTAFMVVGLATFVCLQRTLLYSDMQMKMTNARSSLAAVLDQDVALGEGEGGEGSRHIPSVSGIKRYMTLRTQRQFSRILATQKKVLLACLSIAYVFVVTLALFPALTARIEAKEKTIPAIVFVAIHFLVFNVGDLFGRLLPSVLPGVFLLRSVKVVAACSFLRTAFVPLFTFCNVADSSLSAGPTSKIFGDGIFFTLVALLGITNGLLSTSLFVSGPRQENLVEANEQSLAAGLLSWWLTLGLAVGSLSSFVVAASV